MTGTLAGDAVPAGCLVLVSGPPGSGKTTEARRLEQERRGVRFCPDEWMTALGASLWDGDLRARVEALQWELACQVLRGGGTAIIEWGTWGRDERERLRTEAQALGARTELLHLDVALDELWRRVHERGAEDPPMERSQLAEVHALVHAQRPDDAERSRYDAVLHAFELRRATAADASGITDVAERAYAPYLPRMGGVRPGPMDMDYDAAVADSEVWVAEAGGRLVGFLVLVPEAEGMLLEGVAVLPSHQGGGIGRALISLAEGRALADGHERIRLYTHETMIENQRRYERIGYVETHRGGEHGLVFYEKTLEAAQRPH